MFVGRIKNNNMATVKFVLYKSNKRKDGSYPVCLRVSKKGKLKYIDLKLSALVRSILGDINSVSRNNLELSSISVIRMYLFSPSNFIAAAFSPYSNDSPNSLNLVSCKMNLNK